MAFAARQITLALILLSAWATTAPAAELSDTMPAGTLVYISWPGADAFGSASKDTAWGKLMAEPEIVRARQQWNAQIWPALDKMIRQNMGSGPQAEAYDPALNLLSAAWKYPTALGVAGVDMAPDGPKVDVGLVIRAGADAGKLADNMETILKIALGSDYQPRETKVGEATLRELTLPNVNIPLTYGAIGQDFLLSVGASIPAHWAAGAQAKPLTTSERFATAMKATGGSTATPLLFIDLRGTIETIEKFQPLFAAQSIPIVGEPGGLQKLLDGIGLGTIQSFSAAMKPGAGGFTTTCFLHAPNLGQGAGALFVQKPLTDDDLKTVPRDVDVAVISNFDLAAAYRSVLSAVKAVAPNVYDQVMPKIEELENNIGVKIEQDLLGSFADTWAFYDAPVNGGFWFTGIVGIGELKKDNKLDESLDKIVKAVAGMIGDKYPITIRDEEYRGRKVRFLNVGNLPVPLAPAWSTVDDHCIFGLFPQMVRTVIDQQADKGPTLLDNPDFQRGRKQMPANFSSISYTETVGGVRFAYSILAPLGVAGANMAQNWQIPMDASFLPSSHTLTKHLFGNVSASATTKDGVLSVSYGPIPAPVPAASAGGAVATSALTTSILLPSLARARETARRAVSMNNLQQIGLGCLTYANDHDGKLPPDLETLTQGKRALLQEKLLKSPCDKTGAKVSYVYVKGLTNKAPKPSQTVVAYENPESHDTSQGLHVLFLDGHVERMSKSQFEKALEETKDRIGEPSKERPATEGAQGNGHPARLGSARSARLHSSERAVRLKPGQKATRTNRT